MATLATTLESKANAKQRQGRAGRVRPGVCYKLFTKSRWSKMDAQETPELLRLPLEQLCLRVKAIGHDDLADFMAKLMDPVCRLLCRLLYHRLHSVLF